MKKEMLAAAVCAAFMGSSVPAYAACKATSVFFSGSLAETEGEMTVVSGTSCWSGVNGISGALSEVKITQQPKVGKAGVENMRPYYMAKPGYQGPDEFTYAYIGTDQYGGPMKISIKRKITVVPSL
ncbi:hypothetical protein [Microvirga flavescens]|uniref:hypothetical protein n=1 Tax=Microvirga flavescens TaxID=2249811 RepID=UPI001300AB06|nr:hypothetical protein [Microvirga flavescens]